MVVPDTSTIAQSNQNLPMIYANDEIIESKSDQGIAGRRNQFSFNHHRTRAEHVNIALIELAKASPRGTIGAPDRLNLIAFEKLRQLILILRDHARQRHREIVTQGQIGLAGLFMFAAFENFEDELIAFFAVLAHQSFDVFDGGCFQRFETVTLVHGLYDADDVFALAHVSRQKVAHAAGWLCLG